MFVDEGLGAARTSTASRSAPACSSRRAAAASRCARPEPTAKPSIVHNYFAEPRTDMRAMIDGVRMVHGDLRPARARALLRRASPYPPSRRGRGHPARPHARATPRRSTTRSARARWARETRGGPRAARARRRGRCASSTPRSCRSVAARQHERADDRGRRARGRPDPRAWRRDQRRPRGRGGLRLELLDPLLASVSRSSWRPAAAWAPRRGPVRSSASCASSAAAARARWASASRRSASAASSAAADSRALDSASTSWALERLATTCSRWPSASPARRSRVRSRSMRRCLAVRIGHEDEACDGDDDEDD